MLSLIKHGVIDEYALVRSREPQNHVVVVAVIHALVIGPDPHLSSPPHRPSRIWKKTILHQLDDQPSGIGSPNKFLVPDARPRRQPVAPKSEKPAEGKIRVRDSLQRLPSIGN